MKQCSRASSACSPLCEGRWQISYERALPAAGWNLQTGSAFALPFPDNTFDLVINTYMLDLLPGADSPKVLREFHRVLRPSGRLVLVTFGLGEFWFNRFWFWLAKTFPALLTNWRPVRVDHLIEQIGMGIIHNESVSQNTFPSDITIAVKGETS